MKEDVELGVHSIPLMISIKTNLETISLALKHEFQLLRRKCAGWLAREKNGKLTS